MCGSNTLGIRIFFAQEQQEQLSIMLQLVNTGWDFSVRKISVVYAVTTPLKLGGIFFMSAKGLTNTGIQEEIQ